ALVLPHYVRHADAGEHKVVPARGNGRVAVERAQVRIDVVGARGAGVDRLGARDDGQVGRHGTEPALGVGRLHGDGHQVADFLAGEQQVVADLFVGQADVLQLVVAHGRCAMTVQAVVDEQLRAVLQGGDVVDAVGRLVQGVAAFGGVRGRTCKRECDGTNQLL